MLSGSSGFTNAPASKLAWVVVLGASLAVMITGTAEMLWFAPNRAFTSPHELLWRVPVSFCFVDTPLALITVLLLVYQWRMFERQLGTAKACTLTAFAFLAHVLVCTASLVLLPNLAVSCINGPYSALLAFAVLYARDVPATERFKLCGTLHGSDKWLTYALVVQAVAAGMPGSLIGAISGVLLGVLYRSSALGLGDYRPPNWISKCCAAVFLPILEPQPGLQQRRMAAMVGPGRRLDGNAEGADVAAEDYIFAASDNPQPIAAAEPAQHQPDMTPDSSAPTGAVAADMPADAVPAAAAVSTLVSMGFDETRARAALSRCGGTNVEAAAALLIDSRP